MRESNKIFKRHYILLCIVSILTLLFTLSFISHNTSALDYSSNTNVQFTFNPVLNLTISDDLIIDNLTPGTYSDSNIVDINVSTNSVTGYNLSATVGTNSTNTKLTNTTSSSSYFTNLTNNKSKLSEFTDNTWGYSYSVDNGTNWISGDNTINPSTSTSNASPGYNGLPLDTNTTASDRGKNGVTLINTDASASSSNVKFKIGAKASSTQAAGTYTNTINFYVISKVPPMSISDAFAAAGKTRTASGYYTMQDMTASICNATELVGLDSTTTLIDIRDGDTYMVSKLKDGNCWMASDLNLTGRTALYSDTSDVPDGYPISGGVAYYTLPASAIVSANGYTLADATQFSMDNGHYVFNSGNITSTQSDCDTTHPCNSYYSWLTATAGGKNSSGVDVTGDGYNAAYSICPKGWHLPTATTESVPRNDGGWTGGDFYRMLNQYGLTTGSYLAAADTTPTGASVFANIKAGTAPNLLRTGYYNFNNFGYGGGAGYYWSSTSNGNSKAYYFDFTSTGVDSAVNNSRRFGFPVRCLAK